MAAKTNSTITVKPTTRTAMNTTTTKTLTTTNFTSRSEPITTVAPTTQIFGTTTETLNTTTIDNTTTINNTRSDNKGGMKMGGIVGIAAGVCLVIFVLCVVLFILYRKRRKPAKPRPTPTLPSASELDGTIYKQSENYSSTINDESDADAHPSPLYTNIDGLGKANERTNPSVGDDGYLKKTQTGLDYNGEGKKKKRKKKIKNKFKTNKNNERHKVQEENTEENPHFVNGENVNENTSKTEHTYINRANSDIEYSEGRAAGTVQRGYPNVNKSQTNTFYENTTEIGLREARNVKGNDTDAMVANYYNVNEKDEGPSEIYENTG